MKEAFDFAFGARPQGGAGLDFVSLTDHNTDSAFGEIAAFQPRYPGKLIIRGTEVTTFRGHLMNHGTGRYLDHRTGAGLRGPPGRGRAARGPHAAPRRPRRPPRSCARSRRPAASTRSTTPRSSPARCRPSPTSAAAARGATPTPRPATARWTRSRSPPGPSGADAPGEPGPNPFTATAIDFWEDKLAKGFRIAAIGGERLPRRRARPPAPPRRRSARRPRWCAPRSCRRPGVECGVEAGHTYVKVTGSGGPDLRFEARPPGFSGRAGDHGRHRARPVGLVHRARDRRRRADADRLQGRRAVPLVPGHRRRTSPPASRPPVPAATGSSSSAGRRSTPSPARSTSSRGPGGAQPRLPAAAGARQGAPADPGLAPRALPHALRRVGRAG